MIISLKLTQIRVQMIIMIVIAL